MQPSRRLQPFAESFQQAERFMKDMTDLMGTDDPQKVYRALRASLHAIRDNILPDSAAHLAAQLPMVIRGLFYEGWKPSETPARDRAHGRFRERVESKLMGVGDYPPEDAAKATFAVLSKHVTEGAVEEIRNALPEDARMWWEQALAKRGPTPAEKGAQRRAAARKAVTRRPGASSKAQQRLKTRKTVARGKGRAPASATGGKRQTGRAGRRQAGGRS